MVYVIKSPLARSAAANTLRVMPSTRDAGAYERRQYKNPPIAQALCEVRFAPGAASWNATVPGRFYEGVKEAYPAIAPQVPPELQMPAPAPGPGITVPLPVFQGAHFATEDGGALVSLTESNLAVTINAPYPGWESFRDRIIAAIDAYVSLGLDTKVVRVGLRYVNRIHIESSSVRLADYFNSPPTTPDDFPDQIIGIFSRWESAYSDDPDLRLIYTFSSLPAEPDSNVFLLDLDLIRLFEEPVPPSDIVELLTELKRRETAAFEAVVTDVLRSQFDGD